MPKRITLLVLLRIVLPLALATSLASCGPNVTKADTYEQMGDGMMASGAFPAAMSVMEKSIKYDPNEPRRWVKLARAQRAADQPALAAMSYQRALDLDPANIEALENMAILMVRAGRFDEAKGYVDPLMSLQPDDIAGMLTLGAIEMFRQHYSEASKYADKLIQDAPSSIGGYALKAHVLSAQGHPTDAADLLAKQTALNPNDQDLALQLMDLYRSGHNLRGIRATARVLANLLPNDPRYQMEVMRADYAEGKLQDANARLAKIQQRYRGNPDVMRAIADFWLGALPHDQALARIIDLTGRIGGVAKAELADLLIDEGSASTAVQLLARDSAGEVNPTNTDLHATYARALLAIGKAQEAKAAAQKVLGFDGTNTVALVVRAHIELAMKDYNSALTDAQLALSNDHEDEESALMVPKIYDAMGNKVLAEQAWGTAQARLPHSNTIARGRADWLVKQGRVADAAQVTGTFARANMGDMDIWRLYHDLCVTAKAPCAKRAATQVESME